MTGMGAELKHSISCDVIHIRFLGWLEGEKGGCSVTG